MANKPLISICIPVYDEGENIDRLLEELDQFCASEPGYRFEFVFTDNASRDNTFEKLLQASRLDTRIRALRFSRNFGFQRSLMMNYLHARGAAAVQLDADLQDPPSVISDFLRHWEKGYKVVYGIRGTRKESVLMRALRRTGYWVISGLSEIDLPMNSGDFRLIDQVIIEKLREFDHKTPYLRGLIASIGFAQTGVLYDRNVRRAGDSKFKLWALIGFGMDGICAYSTKPLRFITIFGLGLGCLTTLLAAYYLYRYFFGASSEVQGFTTLVLITLMSLSINAFFVGMIGEYVGRIFQNSQREPLAIVADRIEPLEYGNGSPGDQKKEA